MFQIVTLIAQQLGKAHGIKDHALGLNGHPAPRDLQAADLRHGVLSLSRAFDVRGNIGKDRIQALLVGLKIVDDGLLFRSRGVETGDIRGKCRELGLPPGALLVFVVEQILIR